MLVAVGRAVTFVCPIAGGVVAEPVRVRRLTDQEGQKLQPIVRRGSTSSVRYRRAMMLPASVGGNRVPVIAKLVQADEDTVRDVIHRFNEIGLACLDLSGREAVPGVPFQHRADVVPVLLAPAHRGHAAAVEPAAETVLARHPARGPVMVPSDQGGAGPEPDHAVPAPNHGRPRWP